MAQKIVNIPEIPNVNANGSAEVNLVDSSGNELESHVTNDGTYHLGVMMQQDVYTDANNSTTSNLTSANSYTFTGTGTSTLGVVGLQWNIKTDQNATIYIEQSDDDTNWDISDPFDYLYSMGGNGGTVQAVSAYWRIRVVLTGTTDTTYFRLLGILCPIADPLPRSLSPDFRLKTESTLAGRGSLDRHVTVSPVGGLMIAPLYRLVGTNFDGAVKDTNFWSETVTGTGAAAQNGEVVLSTGSTADSTAQYNSVRRARFVVGSALTWLGDFKFKTAGTADNIRRCGAYDDNEGFFFELDGTTFSIGARKATADTLVSTGSFNGDMGTDFSVGTSSYYRLEIEWTPLSTFWYVNGQLLHKDLTAHQVNVLTLPIRFENNNDNSSTADIDFDCVGSVISRQGQLETNPTGKYIAGASTTVLKRGAGDLHTVINNDNSGSCIIYDNTAGSGTIIAAIDLAKVLGSLNFNMPFSNGLTVVTTGASAKITVTYE